MPSTNLETELRQPTDERLFGIAEALKKGWHGRPHPRADADRPLVPPQDQVDRRLRGGASAAGGSALVAPDLLLEAKRNGFSDKQIAHPDRIARAPTSGPGARRCASVPAVKQIDTLAAEYPAKTNYLYMTYHGREDDVRVRTARKNEQGHGPRLGLLPHRLLGRVRLVLRQRPSGPCKKLGYETIMVNYNPETVSTDYDICDRLYFEELSFERVLDIYETREAARRHPLDGRPDPQQPRPEAATGPACASWARRRESIDRAEDRHKFSKLLDELGIDQPAWRELRSVAEAEALRPDDRLSRSSSGPPTS